MADETYSLDEAAKLVGVSTQTVRRRKDQLREVGAICSRSGWIVTQEQLEAVGFTVSPVVIPEESSLTDDKRQELEDELEETRLALQSREQELLELTVQVAGLESALDYAHRALDKAETEVGKAVEEKDQALREAGYWQGRLETGLALIEGRVSEEQEPKQGFWSRVFGR